MTLRHIFSAAAGAVIALLLFSSCGSQCKTAAHPVEYATWTTVSMPVRLTLTEPKQFGISGTLKMCAGENMLISARMLGFEVATIYADNDSVQVCVKALDTNCYYSAPISGLSRLYGISLADIQNLLLGHAYFPEKKADDISWTYKTRDTEAGVPVLSVLTIEPSGANPIDCVFGNEASSPVGPVTSSVAVSTRVGKRNLSLMLDESPERAIWNEELKIVKPKISKKARRVDSDEIYKLLGKF